MKNHYPQIRYYRKLAGFTRDELAELLGVSPATISNYENGHTIPTMDMIVRLAHALSVTADQLLGYTIIHKH